MVRRFLGMFQRFMYGRYGGDQLNNCLIISYLILYFLVDITGSTILYILSIAVMGVSLFRLLSRNPMKRREENAKFLKVAGPTLQWMRMQKSMLRDREHRYFKCPQCGQYLRVPRGRGKINVTCRSCGNHFQKVS